MILQRYSVIIFILINIHSVFSQTTTEIFVEGNSKFSSEFYESIIKKNLDDNPEIIKKKILEQLSLNGFLNSKISYLRIDTLKKQITLNIFEGLPTYIRKVNIDLLEYPDSILIKNYFSDFENQIFIQQEIETQIEIILEQLENDGYPFANFIINSIIFIDDVKNHYVDLYLKVDLEKIRKIDRVEIVGNTKTKNNVIINSLRLNKGEIYSQKRIEEIPIILNKLRFFENVKIPQYFVNSKNEGILRIELKEKNTNLFDGLIGYVPSTNNNKGYFTGFVNVSLKNLFGTGRAFFIRWQQENSLSQEMELKYLEPWIFNQPFNIRTNFFQRRQDSSYVKRIIGGDIEFLATENISASVIVESESIIPNLENTTVLKSSSLNSGLQLKLDYRDNVLSPTEGIYFSSIYKYRAKSINNIKQTVANLESNNLEYHNYELAFGIYHSFFQSQVLALTVKAKEIIGDFFDLSDYFQLGGTNTLRGYKEKQFLGNRIIWSNLEYRFLLSQSSYVFGFYDSGYYFMNAEKEHNKEKKSDYLNGYGVGISLETALGIMRVSYAFAEGTSITKGLIHFGLLNDF